MTRQKYQTQLDELREDPTMSTLVIEQFQNGLNTLETHDKALSPPITKNDKQVDDRYLDLDDDCIDPFALQQSVVGDLRFVAVSFKIAPNLERIADLAVNLVEYSIEADSGAFPRVNLCEIEIVAIEMHNDTMNTYAPEDVWACHEVASCHDDLNVLCKRGSMTTIRNLIETKTQTETVVKKLVQNEHFLIRACRPRPRMCRRSRCQHRRTNTVLHRKR